MCSWLPVTSSDICFIKWVSMSVPFTTCLYSFTRAQAVRATIKGIELTKLLEKALRVKCSEGTGSHHSPLQRSLGNKKPITQTSKLIDNR